MSTKAACFTVKDVVFVHRVGVGVVFSVQINWTVCAKP